MPTSTGYEQRTDATYDWDGRKRGQTPFTVLQHTISGAGNLRYENRTLSGEGGRNAAGAGAAQSPLLARAMATAGSSSGYR
jgi:hypothetical protein